MTFYTGWPRPFFSETSAYISFNFEVTQNSLNMGRFENYTFYLRKYIIARLFWGMHWNCQSQGSLFSSQGAKPRGTVRQNGDFDAFGVQNIFEMYQKSIYTIQFLTKLYTKKLSFVLKIAWWKYRFELFKSCQNLKYCQFLQNLLKENFRKYVQNPFWRTNANVKLLFPISAQNFWNFEPNYSNTLFCTKEENQKMWIMSGNSADSERALHFHSAENINKSNSHFDIFQNKEAETKPFCDSISLEDIEWKSLQKWGYKLVYLACRPSLKPREIRR